MHAVMTEGNAREGRIRVLILVRKPGCMNVAWLGNGKIRSETTQHYWK